MLTIVVTDLSAESRNKIVEHISSLLQNHLSDLNVIPRVSIKPLSRQELKFHSPPDICIVGEEIVAQEMTEVGSIKKLLPETSIIVRTNKSTNNLFTVEQLARLGADDVMPGDITPTEFIRKLIILARRSNRGKSGHLILVDSGKGGIGVTSVVAGLGEALVARKKKVVVIDLDFESQDLSRFLRARPFINENLQMLLDNARPITQEFVEQCLVRVWDEEEGFVCMPPVLETDNLFDTRSTYPRTFVSILEVLDSKYDFVIVDVGSARGTFLKTLYRVADKILFVLNNDPATLYASVDRLTRARTLMAPNASLAILENASSKFGLPHNLLQQEFNRAARVTDNDWARAPLPFCRGAQKWPGSGATLFSQGKNLVSSALTSVIEKLSIVDSDGAQDKSLFSFELVKKWRESFASKKIITGTIPVSAATIDHTPVLEAPKTTERLELPEPELLVGHPIIEARSMGSEKLLSEPTSSKSVKVENEEVDFKSLISGVNVT